VEILKLALRRPDHQRLHSQARACTLHISYQSMWPLVSLKINDLQGVFFYSVARIMQTPAHNLWMCFAAYWFPYKHCGFKGIARVHRALKHAELERLF